jgi:hypothetical protein
VIRSLARRLRDRMQGIDAHEPTRELAGLVPSRMNRPVHRPESQQDVECRVPSQFGDDGIIQWLVGRRQSLPPRLIEFGVAMDSRLDSNSLDQRQASIRGLPLVDVAAGRTEPS